MRSTLEQALLVLAVAVFSAAVLLAGADRAEARPHHPHASFHPDRLSAQTRHSLARNHARHVAQRRHQHRVAARPRRDDTRIVGDSGVRRFETASGSALRDHPIRRLASADPASDVSTSEASANTGSGGASVVAEARRWIGGNPTGRRSLWCARFMNFVLQRTGHLGTGSDLARSFASYGHRLSGPQVRAIAVMARRGGGHVGVISAIDRNGNLRVISGNHGHRVAESVYSKSSIYAYVTRGA